MDTGSRPLKNIGLEERKRILLELQTEPSIEVRKRHNISNQTVSHLRWHYGPIKKGSYHRDILAGAESPLKIKIRELKKEGKNSLEISKILNLSLQRINEIWVSCDLKQE
jgi:hypothetical protein